MKIIYILSGTGILGGATKSFLNLLNHGIDSGHEFTVITPDRNGIYEILKNKGIKVFSLPYYFNTTSDNSLIKKLKYTVKHIFNLYSALKLKRICQKFNPDIIHTNTTVNDIGYLTAKWLRIPHVWHIREYGDKDFNLHIPHLSRRLKEPLNFSIAITRDIASYRQVSGLENNRVIYNGIITHQLLSLPKAIKENYFLYAGRIEATKGIEDCINAFIAFSQETKSNTCLYIAGTPTPTGEILKTNLIDKITRSGLSDSIHWLGGRKDIDSLMSKAIATIVPSHFEGFGRVMPEAMANGCLVIGRNTGGTKEQFDNGRKLTGREIGLRFDSVDDLKNCLIDVCHNGQYYYRQMIEDAFTTVNNLYTNEIYGKQVYEFYNQILAQ